MLAGSCGTIASRAVGVEPDHTTVYVRRRHAHPTQPRVTCHADHPAAGTNPRRIVDQPQSPDGPAALFGGRRRAARWPTRRRPVPPWRSGRRARGVVGRSWLPGLSDDRCDDDRPRVQGHSLSIVRPPPRPPPDEAMAATAAAKWYLDNIRMDVRSSWLALLRPGPRRSTLEGRSGRIGRPNRFGFPSCAGNEGRPATQIEPGHGAPVQALPGVPRPEPVGSQRSA